MDLIQLIQSVKKQSNIYRNMHEDDEEYLREWQMVAEECQISTDEAQDQWNMLLLEYMEYLKGNHDFNMSKYMDFIQPYMFTIFEDDVIDEDELLNILSEERTPSGDGKAPIYSKTYPLEKEEITQQAEAVEAVNVKKAISPILTRVPAPPPPKPPVLGTPAPLVLESCISNEPSFSKLTSIEMIFLGYAKQLQKMPLPLQQQIKRKVAEIMDEAELKMMDDQL